MDSLPNALAAAIGQNESHVSASTSTATHESPVSQRNALVQKLNEETKKSCESPEESGFSSGYYIPPGALRTVISRDAVRQLLQNTEGLRLPQNVDIEVLTTYICGPKSDDVVEDATQPQSVCCGARRIFATLLRVSENGYQKIIESFGDKISDKDLPFSAINGQLFLNGLPPRPSNSQPASQSHSADLSQDANQILRGLTSDEVKEFDTFQWRMCPIIFGQNQRDETPSYKGGMIFPWTSYQISETTGGEIPVHEVEIDEGHHAFPGRTSKFALKVLVKSVNSHDEKQTREEFRREIEALRGCSERNMMHTIRLLSTFEYKGNRFLLFPWADGGDLKTMWKRFPNPSPSFNLVSWFAKQCRGVSEDLAILHDSKWPLEPPTGNTSPAEDPQPYSDDHVEPALSLWQRFMKFWANPPVGEALSARDPEEGRVVSLETRGSEENGHRRTKPYGIHGDLAARNFLCFDFVFDRDDIQGTIRISDFGSCRFFSKTSRSTRKPKVAHQVCYRAPELDELDDNMDQPYSPKYDVWSLGCVLLEFVSWILLGYNDGIENFRSKRLNERDDMGERGRQWAEDKFFNNFRKKLKTPFGKKTVKECVVEVSGPTDPYPRHMRIYTLRRRTRDRFLRRLLRFIEKRMLVIVPDERASMDELVEWLKQTPRPQLQVQCPVDNPPGEDSLQTLEPW